MDHATNHCPLTVTLPWVQQAGCVSTALCVAKDEGLARIKVPCPVRFDIDPSQAVNSN